MGTALADWPSGGPRNWLATWEDLLYRTAQQGKPFDDWLEDVSLAWIWVQNLSHFFHIVEDDITNEETERYSYASVSAKIQQCWERKKQGSALRIAKPRTTRSAFTTEEVTLNGEEADAPEETTTKKTAKKGKRKRNESRTSSESQHPSSAQARPSKAKKRDEKRGDRDPCSACGGKSHPFFRCFLALGIEKKFLTQEARDTFANNMKETTSRKKIEDFKKVLSTMKAVAGQ